MERVPARSPRGVRPLTVIVIGIVVAGALLGARSVGRFAASAEEPVRTSPTALVSVDLVPIEPVPLPPVATSAPGYRMSSSRGRSGGDVPSVREALARQLELPVAVVRCLAELVGDEDLLRDPLAAVAANPACAGSP